MSADAVERFALVFLPFLHGVHSYAYSTVKQMEAMDQYDVIFIGYPIWHGQAPKILYTLLEGIDLAGKTIVPFCTSISSGVGSSAKNLSNVTGNAAVWLDATRIPGGATSEQIAAWAISAQEAAMK